MGVSINVYAMYGVKLKWNDDFYDEYEKISEEVFDGKENDDFKNLNILIDGMSGEFMYFGKTLFDSGDFRWGCEDASGDVEIDINSLSAIKNEYLESFKKVFPNFLYLISDLEFKLMIFTFYS